jgi:hypothetical protein
LNAAALSSGGGSGTFVGRSKTPKYSPVDSRYTLIGISPPSGGNNVTGTELVSVLASSFLVQVMFMLRLLSSVYLVYLK